MKTVTIELEEGIESEADVGSESAAACLRKLESSVLSSTKPDAIKIRGVVIGTVDAVRQWDDRRQIEVSYVAGQSMHSVPAKCLTGCVIREGMEVALMFNDGDPLEPIVMGPLEYPLVTVKKNYEEEPNRLELKARDEIVLSCGKASLILTRAGKVLLRGAYVSTQSSGANRVRGASVQIN